MAVHKLGRIALAASPDGFVAGAGLGPDALQLGRQSFLSMAASLRGAVKSWLMDQRCIAGIGNIYSDEMLFQAGIHPKHRVKALERPSLQQLYKAMRSVLEQAIEANVEPANMPHDFLLAHREQGGRCPKCDSPLKTLKAAGRTAWYCPRCQRY